jgi:hypothetical protein
MKRSQLKSLVKTILKEVAENIELNKPTYIKTLGLEFGDDEVKLMVSAVEQFGNGEHPSADKDSIGYFDKDYVAQCLEKLRPAMEQNSRLKPFVPKVDELIKKLNSGYGVTSEESSTGGVAGYSTPNAFTKNKKGSAKGIEAAKKYGKVVGEAPRV